MGQGLSGSGIGYCEVPPPDGEFNLSFEGDGVRLVRTIQLDDPTKIYEAGWFAVGYPTGIGGGLSRWLPDAYPITTNTAGDDWLYCTKVLRTEGKGATGTDAQGRTIYKIVRLTLLYETLPYDVLPDGVPEYERFLTSLPRSATEFDTGVRGTYAWQEGPNSTDFATNGGVLAPPAKATELFSGLAIPVGIGDIAWVWNDVPDGAFSPSGIDAATGSVNLTPITVGGTTYGVGTILLNSVARVPKKSAIGDRIWTITFNIKRMNQDQNTFRDADGNYWLIGNVADGIPPFAYVEFANLFTPAGP